MLAHEIADRLLQLPLTLTLWSLAISILPVDEAILKRLLKELTPELWSVLETSVIKYTSNFKVLDPLSSAGKQWLTLAKKLII